VSALQPPLQHAVEIVVGAEALTQCVLRLQNSATTHYDAFVKPPFEAVGFAEAEPLTDPDVVYRTVYDRQILEHPESLRRIIGAEADKDESRMHQELPTKMLIADRSTAMLPLPPDPVLGPRAVVVHAGGLLPALNALFDHYWAASIPLPLDDTTVEIRTDRSGSRGLSGDDRRILSMLLAGATDVAVARQLGLSVRTVQRRVAEMMAAAGVVTRIQLGWFAARNGWV
jgi:hypothetical protein